LFSLSFKILQGARLALVEYKKYNHPFHVTVVAPEMESIKGPKFLMRISPIVACQRHMQVSESPELENEKVKDNEEIIRLAIERIRGISATLSRAQDSLDSICEMHYAPRAQQLLVSLVRRYKKLKKIRRWNDLEKSLSEELQTEYIMAVKGLLMYNYPPCIEPDITWKYLEDIIPTYFPDAQKIFHFLKAEMMKLEFPLSC
jgi:hypothetical protein